MAVKYVRSAAAGAATGADWTNAYTTVAAALAVVAAGDTIYVADDHAETQASGLTWTSPGTAAAPVNILCVNTHVTTPPTALAATATVSTTSTATISFGTGFAYVYGIAFSATSSSAAAPLNIASTGAAWGWKFDTCILKINNTATTARFTVGASGGKDSILILRNTVVNFSNASQSILLLGAKFHWLDTASAVAGTVPTTLILINTPTGLGEVLLSGVDLSALGSGKTLISASSALPAKVFLRNCKLGASVTSITGTIASQGGVEVYFDNCDSGSTNYRMEHYKYQGSIVQETTIVKSSGASDGTTALTHKMVALSSGPSLFYPFEGPWVTQWNETTGSALAVSFDIVHDSLTNLKDNEVWIEVEYLGNGSYPLSSYITDRVSDSFGTAADQDTSSPATWTTTGLTNPNKQRIGVSITPQRKGPIRARVCVAKTNYTVYYDPLLSVV